MMAAHPIVHIEFATTDPQAASKFYGDLFGWEIQNVPEMNYVMFAATGGPGGGFPQADNEMYKPGDVLVYIGTDDIDATLARIEALGGKTLMPKTEIPGSGWFGIFSDPTGARAALYTAMDS